MNDPKPLRDFEEPAAPGYAGRTRYTQLEYEALLANLSIGIAFTRERRFFLCNPRFAEMFGYGPDELIGKAGETVYPSRESYLALAQIASPVLGAGRQLEGRAGRPTVGTLGEERDVRHQLQPVMR